MALATGLSLAATPTAAPFLSGGHVTPSPPSSSPTFYTRLALTATPRSVLLGKEPGMIGVTATGAAGAIVVDTAQRLTISSVQGVGFAGGPNIGTSTGLNLLGAFGTGETGTLTVLAGASSSQLVPSVAGQGVAGTIAVSVTANVSLLGLQALGRAGITTAVIGAFVPLPGVEALGLAGDVADITRGGTVYLNGAEGVGRAGDFDWSDRSIRNRIYLAVYLSILQDLEALA